MIKRVYGFVKAYGSMGALPSIIAAVESGELEMAEFIAVICEKILDLISISKKRYFKLPLLPAISKLYKR